MGHTDLEVEKEVFGDKYDHSEPLLASIPITTAILEKNEVGWFIVDVVGGKHVGSVVDLYCEVADGMYGYRTAPYTFQVLGHIADSIQFRHVPQYEGEKLRVLNYFGEEAVIRVSFLSRGGIQMRNAHVTGLISITLREILAEVHGVTFENDE